MSKKNFRKIPAGIRRKLARIANDDVVVGAILNIPEIVLQSGAFAHLGLPLPPAGQSTIDTVPPENRGKCSAKNVNGEEIVRKDLPKETHYNYIESPNWGDESNGTHEVALPYEKYPRDFVPPRNTAISAELVRRADDASVYKFTVREVVRKADEGRLLECINLLQENVGAVDVFPSDYNFAQYMSTMQIAWELLPPGERDRIMARLASGRTISPEKQRLIDDRYAYLLSLNPTHMVVGSSGLQRYFGGMIRPNLVVFENIEYGNAVYVMYEDWEQLSRRSRVELLSGRFGRNFDRVVHVHGWKGRVKQLIDARPT